MNKVNPFELNEKVKFLKEMKVGVKTNNIEIRMEESNEEIDIYNLYIDKKESGKVKVYKVTEEERQVMKSKLKKNIKVGDVFSVKVFLKENVSEDLFENIKSAIKERYKRGTGRIYFLRGEESRPSLIRELRWD